MLAWNSPSMLGWPASGLQESACLYHPSSEIILTCPYRVFCFCLFACLRQALHPLSYLSSPKPSISVYSDPKRCSFLLKLDWRVNIPAISPIAKTEPWCVLCSLCVLLGFSRDKVIVLQKPSHCFPLWLKRCFFCMCHL